MRKIFLLTTLLVTTSALAFSGLVGGIAGGHKSKNYSGGADAIGVHFNGKSADSGEAEEAGCPSEKQCGDYCCQGDTVCNKDTNECCSEELNHCCPANQSIYKQPWGAPDCCDGVIYCGLTDVVGECISPNQCCPNGRTLHGPLERDNGEKEYWCCPNGQNPYCFHKFSYGCSYSCCNGTVSPGTGTDGADECLE